MRQRDRITDLECEVEHLRNRVDALGDRLDAVMDAITVAFRERRTPVPEVMRDERPRHLRAVE
jgi:hypothetical protein